MCHNNHIKFWKNPQRAINIQLLKNNYNWEEIHFRSKLEYREGFAKKKKYVLLLFQNLIQIDKLQKAKLTLMFLAVENKSWHYLTVKKNWEGFLREVTSKHAGDFHCLICFLRNYFMKENKLMLKKTT